MEKCFNKIYKLEYYDEYYDDYLKEIGLNALTRKIARSIRTTIQIIKIDDDEYVFNMIIPFKTHQQRFVLGRESEALTIDNRKIKNIFVIDGNKLIEEQIEPERKVVITREFCEEEVIGEVVVGDVKCKFWCVAVK